MIVYLKYNANLKRHIETKPKNHPFLNEYEQTIDQAMFMLPALQK